MATTINLNPGGTPVIFNVDASGKLLSFNSYHANGYIPLPAILDISSCATSQGVTITSIGTEAFWNFFVNSGAVTTVILPNSVTSIGASAFIDCAALASITLPSGITTISNSTFSGCTSLTSVALPSGLASVGIFAFKECSSLASITLPSSLTTINASAFEDCSSLASITLPSGITTIGDRVFINCSSLASIVFTGSYPSILAAAITQSSPATIYYVTGTTYNGGAWPSTINGANVVQLVAPGVPTNISAIPGDGSANISWTAPANAVLVDYAVLIVFPFPLPNQTITTRSTSATVTGLTNGTYYSIFLTASNIAGTSDQADGGNVCPGSPTPPRNVAATAGNGQASIAFTAPASDNGSAIIRYNVAAFQGGVVVESINVEGATSPIVVTGLDNGSAYTFTVTATNSVGESRPSPPSSAITPSTVAATAPGAPTIGSATAGDGQASVSFTAPASNGGSAITSYTVTSSPGGFTATGSSSPIVVTGLSNGTAYTFTVTATNSVGNGSASASSSAVTPTNGGGGGGDGDGGVRCFTADSRILTPTGYKAAKDLQSGDLVMTADCRAVAINASNTTVMATQTTAPFCIPAGSLGRNLPASDLRLSPLHGFQVRKGVWQNPLSASESNSAIRQYGLGKEVSYYHFETPNYFTDNLVCEGMIVESFANKQVRKGEKVYTYNRALHGYTRSNGSERRSKHVVNVLE